MDKEKYGKRIAWTGILSYYDEPFPLVHYISGINDFDKFLNYKLFAETDNWHSIIFYENAIEFLMGNSNSDFVQKVSYDKSTLSKIIIEENKKIKIRKFNKKSKALKTGALGNGVAGVLLTGAIGAVSDKLTTKIMGISSEEVDGTIFKLIFTENISKKIIELSCLKEHTKDVTDFFDKRFQKVPDPDPDENSSACYIATVCYNDNMAPEVIRFRAFRDNYLKHNYLGQKFIKFYYKNAEEVSKRLKNKPIINKLVKNLILNPIYYIIRILT